MIKPLIYDQWVILINTVLQNSEMKTLLTLILWAILLVLCWPIALLVLILWPILWLLSIPFRIVRTVMDAILALVKSILFLPAKILGYKNDT